MSEQSSVTASGNSGLANVTILEPGKLLPWMMLACILSGVALGLSVVTLHNQAQAYKELERENRLAQLKIDEFRMALMNAGIDPNPHLEAESK